MSTKDTLARLAESEDDPFDFIGRKVPQRAKSAETPAEALVAPPAEAPAPRLKQITARLDEDLHRRLKLYLAQTGEEQQELISRLLAAYFDASGSV